jgi:integrase
MHEATMLRYLTRNPLDEVTAPRAPRHEMQTLTREQVQRLLLSTKGTRWHALWGLLVSTGLRLGEATALRWSDLDLAKGAAIIQRSVQRQPQMGMVFVEPMTRTSRRKVQLPLGVVHMLKDHRALVAKQRLAASVEWQDNNLVFPALSGGPIDPARVNQALHMALHRAGLPPVRVHDLRHTAATLLLEAGTHPKVVQDLLGHSSIAMTLDLYSHVTPRIQQEATTRMQEVLFGTETEHRTARKQVRG